MNRTNLHTICGSVVLALLVTASAGAGESRVVDLEMTSDPYELKNLATDPSASAVLGRMRARLAELVKQTGAR